MANERSTLGMRLYYAVETSGGTRPTAGYTELPDITDLPELGSTPDTIEVTPLSETKSKRYIPGLMDTGTYTMTANMTDTFVDAWDGLQSAFDTAQSGNKSVWFAVVHPTFDKAYYFTGEPSDLPLAAAAPNSAWQVQASITVNTTEGYAAKPTDLAA